MIVRRQLLKAALAACTDDDTRYYLAGVHLRPDGTVEATDGHIAVRLHEPSGPAAEDFPQVPGYPELTETTEPTAPVVIDRTLIESLARQKDQKGRYPIEVLDFVQVRETPEGVILGQTDLCVPMVTAPQAREGKMFPKLDAVFPKPARGTPLPLGLPVLKALVKILESVKAPGVVLDVPAASWNQPRTGIDFSAVRFAARGALGAGIDVVGVLMPVNHLEDAPSLRDEFPAKPTEYQTLVKDGAEQATCSGCGLPIVRKGDYDDWIGEDDGDACGASGHLPGPPAPAVCTSCALLARTPGHQFVTCPTCGAPATGEPEAPELVSCGDIGCEGHEPEEIGLPLGVE